MENNNGESNKYCELKLENLRLRQKIVKLESILDTTIYPEYLDLEINNLSKRIKLISNYFRLKINKI
jgi:hypothetical protein